LDKTFGVNISRYISPNGNVNIIRHVLFEGNVYDEYAVGLDMENIGMKVMQPTILKMNIQANDADGWEDEYLTEAGFMLMLESTHGVLKNIGGAAVT
jgi:hypothetical protein